jgi:nicotinamide riboside kinase
MIRIAVTGPESSGKTTLSKALAEVCGGEWVPEYARFGLKPDEDVTPSTLTSLAQAQLALLTQAAAKQPKLLVADTEFVVFDIWHREVFGIEMPRWKELYAAFPFDYFLVCAPDIPWEADPLRSNPHDRERLMQSYLAKLDALECPYSILKGSHKLRMEVAQSVVKKIMGTKK